MLSEHLQHGHEPTEDRDLLSAALSRLPVAEHQRILTEFILTACSCEITRDYGSLRHLTDSLFVTAHLHLSREYSEALELAQSTDATQVTDLRDYLDEKLAKKRR